MSDICAHIELKIQADIAVCICIYVLSNTSIYEHAGSLMKYISVDLVLIMRFYFRTCHCCQLAPITRELPAGEQALAHWHDDLNP
jgi:hypothetical protein